MSEKSAKASIQNCNFSNVLDFNRVGCCYRLAKP